jgi:glycerol kinase
MAFQTRDVVDAMANAAGFELDSLRADGGAASDFVLQLQADQIGVSVSRPLVPETTALGAAYLAGLAEGFWSSLDDISTNWALDRTFVPVGDRTRADASHQQWLRAVERTRGWATDL